MRCLRYLCIAPIAVRCNGIADATAAVLSPWLCLHLYKQGMFADRSWRYERTVAVLHCSTGYIPRSRLAQPGSGSLSSFAIHNYVNNSTGFSIVASVLLLLAASGCGGENEGFSGDAPSDTTAGSQGSYRAIDVRDGGKISGRVMLAGNHPALEKFHIPADQAACAAASENNRLEVGPGGGIASAVVFIEGIAEGKAMPLLPRSALTMDQRNCVYIPHVLAVPVGDTVVFLNSDDLAHNVRVEDLASEAILLNVAQPKAGYRDPMAIQHPGPVQVGCDYHPWMNAYVFGVDNPYYVVTDTSGAFVLEDLPPGTYTVKMWLNGFDLKPRTDNQGRIIRYAFGQPYLLQRQVTVAANGVSEIAFEVSAQ